MCHSAVSDGLDAVKSSPHTGTSHVRNLGEAPFSAEAPLVAGRSTKPATGGVMAMGWDLEAGQGQTNLAYRQIRAKAKAGSTTRPKPYPT